MGAGDASTATQGQAPRTSTEQVEALSDDVVALTADVEALKRRVEGEEAPETRDAPSENPEETSRNRAGQAMGVTAERIDDLEKAAFDAASEQADTRRKKKEAVAPYIAAAEAEMEAKRGSSRPTDIFDRIAQAAESQFEEGRGRRKPLPELVDDRRVGTKRWTPSKTMKERMEKLEAARAARTGDKPAAEAEAAPKAEAPAEAVVAEAAPAAPVEAPAPKAEAVAAPAPEAAPGAPTEPEAPVETVRISRKSRQQMREEDDAATEAGPAAPIEDEDDHDALRIVPGARGRRRDRARKSRLDEDFESIFEEADGKPSIGSLRRKLRAGAQPEEEAPAPAAAAEADAPAVAATREDVYGAAPEAPAKATFFARLLGRGKKAPAAAEASQAEDDAEAMVAAFEQDAEAEAMGAPDAGMDDILDATEAADAEASHEEAVTAGQRAIWVPICAAGAVITLGGIGYFIASEMGLL